MEKRLFVGIKVDPSPTLLSFYSKLKENLKQDKIKWVPIENMHLTLKFFGTVELRLIPNIEAELKQICFNSPPFSIEIKDLGRFAQKQKTKVIWLGVAENKKLLELTNAIDIGVQKHGFEPENRTFKPHLTLGRVNYLQNEKKLTEYINCYSGKIFQRIDVENVSLFESVLRPKETKYWILTNFSLNTF